jgi:hypothetical protein
MEMKKSLIGLSILSLILGAYFYLNRDLPQDKIQTQLTLLTQEAVKPLTLKGVPKMAQISSLRNFFTEDLQIHAYQGRFSLKGRDELMKRLQLAYGYLKSFSLSFEDVTIKLNSSQDEASVYLTALATGAGNDWNQAQELEMVFRLDSGEWLISSAKAIDTLTLDK